MGVAVAVAVGGRAVAVSVGVGVGVSAAVGARVAVGPVDVPVTAGVPTWAVCALSVGSNVFSPLGEASGLGVVTEVRRGVTAAGVSVAPSPDRRFIAASPPRTITAGWAGRMNGLAMNEMKEMRLK